MTCKKNHVSRDTVLRVYIRERKSTKEQLFPDRQKQGLRHCDKKEILQTILVVLFGQ